MLFLNIASKLQMLFSAYIGLALLHIGRLIKYLSIRIVESYSKLAKINSVQRNEQYMDVLSNKTSFTSVVQ